MRKITLAALGAMTLLGVFLFGMSAAFHMLPSAMDDKEVDRLTNSVIANSFRQGFYSGIIKGAEGRDFREYHIWLDEAAAHLERGEYEQFHAMIKQEIEEDKLPHDDIKL